MKYRFKKNIELDACMVMAIRAGLFERWAMGQGILPNEAFARQSWLPKQSRQYLHAVEMEIRRIQGKNLMDKLS